MRVQLPVDVGGTIRFDPPELAEVTTPTCTIVSPAGVTIDTPTVSTAGEVATLAAAAAKGANTITLSSVSGIAARRRYGLIAASGEREWVRVRSYNGTTKVVSLYERLGAEYASGDSVIDNRLEVTLAEADAGTIDEGYEARFTYTADDEVQRVNVRFDIVRSVWPATLVSTHDLRSYAPNLLRREFEGADTRGTDYADLIELATEAVISDIRAHGRDPARFRSFDPWRRPIMERAIQHLADNGENIPNAWKGNPGEWQMQRRRQYDDAFAQAITIARDYDADQSGDVDQAEASDRVLSVRIRR